jgi:hypothetical protein
VEEQKTLIIFMGGLMSGKWINLDDLEFPSRCPYCGGNRFVVEGARKLFFEATYRVTGESVELLDDVNTDVDWEVAYSLECADCGRDLTEYVEFPEDGEEPD